MSLKNINHFFLNLMRAVEKKKLCLKHSPFHLGWESILTHLQQHNLIGGYKLDRRQNFIKVSLLYDQDGISIIKRVAFISQMRRRRNISCSKIKTFLNYYPYSLAFVRTNQGIMTFRQCLKSDCGGELLVIIE
jgi:ribosomal protein S8